MRKTVSVQGTGNCSFIYIHCYLSLFFLYFSITSYLLFCVFLSLTLPLSSQLYMYMYVHICISFSLVNKLLKIWHVSHSHLQSKQHLTWCLLPHRGATNIWNTCTKICASETCNLTPFLGFSLNIQSTSELELKQMVSTFYYTTMLMVLLILINNIQYYSMVNGREKQSLLYSEWLC